MNSSVTYNAFGHTYDDEDLKKDSKIRKGKSTIRLRKRKKVHAKRTEGLADEKNFKLPLIKQQQIKKRVITPEVNSTNLLDDKTSDKPKSSSSTRRSTVNFLESNENASLVLPDIRRPRPHSATAAAAAPTPVEPMSAEPLDQLSEHPEPSDQLSEHPTIPTDAAAAASKESEENILVEAASAPAQTAAPKNKYTLNFKVDFTKVNFKKKAAKKEHEKKEKEVALLQAVKDAKAKEAAIKAAEKWKAAEEARKAAEEAAAIKAAEESVAIKAAEEAAAIKAAEEAAAIKESGPPSDAVEDEESEYSDAFDSYESDFESDPDDD